jgi:hypothetical protein
MSTTLERRALSAWIKWGLYAKWTQCADCSRWVYCRAKSSVGPFLCPDCHDQRKPRRRR